MVRVTAPAPNIISAAPQPRLSRWPSSLPAHPALQLRGDDRFAMVSWKRMFGLLVTVVRQYMPGGQAVQGRNKPSGFSCTWGSRRC